MYGAGGGTMFTEKNIYYLKILILSPTPQRKVMRKECVLHKQNNNNNKILECFHHKSYTANSNKLKILSGNVFFYYVSYFITS